MRKKWLGCTAPGTTGELAQFALDAADRTFHPFAPGLRRDVPRIVSLGMRHQNDINRVGGPIAVTRHRLGANRFYKVCFAVGQTLLPHFAPVDEVIGGVECFDRFFALNRHLRLNRAKPVECAQICIDAENRRDCRFDLPI